MKFLRSYRLWSVLLLGIFGLSAAMGSQSTEAQNPAAPNTQAASQPRSQNDVQQLIEALYISRMQEELHLSNEQYAAVIPTVKNFLHVRQEGARRKHQGEVELNQLLGSGASDDQVQAKMKELDQVKKQNEQDLEEAHRQIDSKLDVRQQALFRQYQQKIDQHINRMIQQIREGRRMERMGGQDRPMRMNPRGTSPYAKQNAGKK
jgi:hypothetical protein